MRVWIERAIILLVAGGLFVSGVLAGSHFFGILPPCGGSLGCEQLTYDRRAFFIGLPLAYWGMGFYLLIGTFGVLRISHPSRHIDLAATAAAAIGLAVSGYLMYLSQVVIRATCPWCLASAYIVAALLACHAWLLMAGEQPSGHPRRLEAALGDFLCMCAAAGGIWLGAAQEQEEDMVDLRRLRSVSIAELAPPDAPSRGTGSPTLVMFGDLVCPTCRIVLKEMLPLTSRPANGRLVFRHFPIPSHQTARPLAALAEAARQKGRFWEFVEAALQIEPRSIADLEALALRAGLQADAQPSTVDTGGSSYKNVLRDEALAKRLDLRLAPTLFILEDHTYPRQVNLPEAKRVFSRR